MIVTTSFGDFPADVLERVGAKAPAPDSFVRDLLDLDASMVARVIREQPTDLLDPPRSAHDVVDALKDGGLGGNVTTALRTLLDGEPEGQEQ